MKYIKVIKGRKEYFLYDWILNGFSVFFKTSFILAVPFSFYLQCAWDALWSAFLFSPPPISYSFGVSLHPIPGMVIKNEG